MARSSRTSSSGRVAMGMLLQRLRRFSLRQYAAAALLSLLFLSLAGRGRTAVVWLLLLLPVALFFSWVARQQHHHGVTDRELEQLIYCFLAGILPVSVLAFGAQVLLAPLLAILCFFDQRESLQAQLDALINEQRNATSPRHASRVSDLALSLNVDKTFGYFCFLFAMAFIVAALVEEFMKLWVVQGACCCCPSKRPRGCCCCCFQRASNATPMFAAIRQRQQNQQQSRQYGGVRGGPCHPSRLLFFHKKHTSHGFVVFMAVVAGALGFSFLENAVYTFSVEDYRERALTAAVRGAVSTSLHCICGGITGVRLASMLQAHRVGVASVRDSAAIELSQWRTKIRLLIPAILVHGTFDFQIFLFATVPTEKMLMEHPQRYGVVLPGIVTVIILLAAFVYMRKSLHAMEQKMNEGRYIQVAVDLESGRRASLNSGPGRATFASDDEDEFDMFDDDLDDDEVNLVAAVEDRSTPSKVRSVFLHSPSARGYDRGKPGILR